MCTLVRCQMAALVFPVTSGGLFPFSPHPWPPCRSTLGNRYATGCEQGLATKFLL